MTLSHQIAEHIQALRYDDLSAAARWSGPITRSSTRLVVRSPGWRKTRHTFVWTFPGIADGPGPATVWATDRKTERAGCGVDQRHRLPCAGLRRRRRCDGRSSLGHAHPAPLIALGESLGSSGRDLALAYVVGYETVCRIARGVHFHHYDKGWHPTATIGIFGTVAAASRLLALTVDQTAVALGLAASLASGLKANFGTMTKPLHVGHASRNGLFAAYMARDGFTASAGAFEHKQGFLEVFNGPGTYDGGRMARDWYAPLECEGSGEPGLKPYPCCGSTHASINRMLLLAKTHDLHPDEVTRVEVMPHLRRLPHTDNPNPITPLEAKFQHSILWPAH